MVYLCHCRSPLPPRPAAAVVADKGHEKSQYGVLIIKIRAANNKNYGVMAVAITVRCMPVRATVCSGNALTGGAAGRRHRGECRAQHRKDLRCSAAACCLSLTRQNGAAKPGMTCLCAAKKQQRLVQTVGETGTECTSAWRNARSIWSSALAFHAQRVTAPLRRAHQSRRRLASNAGHQRRPKTGLLSART